jgi:SAM-dependent methyltransferase
MPADIQKVFELIKDQGGDRSYFYFHRERFDFLLKKITELFAPGKKFLDIGSFQGYMMLGAKLIGCDVFGVDLEKYVKALEPLSRQYGFDNRAGDLRDTLPFADNTFDLILFSEVLEHFDFHPLSFFFELKRIVKPGGKIIITTPNLCRLNNILSLIFDKSINWDIKENYHENVHRREFSKMEITWLLQSAGLKIESCEFVNFKYSKLGLAVKVTDFISNFWPAKKRDLVIIAEK